MQLHLWYQDFLQSRGANSTTNRRPSMSKMQTRSTPGNRSTHNHRKPCPLDRLTRSASSLPVTILSMTTVTATTEAARSPHNYAHPTSISNAAFNRIPSEGRAETRKPCTFCSLGLPSRRPTRMQQSYWRPIPSWGESFLILCRPSPPKNLYHDEDRQRNVYPDENPEENAASLFFRVLCTLIHFHDRLPHMVGCN